jgi:hypothetical protein
MAHAALVFAVVSALDLLPGGRRLRAAIARAPARASS